MSFILDALRKAERDRNLGQAPRMEDVALAHEGHDDVASPRIRSDRLLLIGLLILVIVGGGLLLLRPAPNAPAAAVAVPPEPVGVVTASVRGPATIGKETPASAPVETSEDTPPALIDDGTIATLDDLDGNVDGAPATGEEAADEPDIERRSDFVAHPTPTIAASQAESPSEATPEPLAAPPPEARKRAFAASKASSNGGASAAASSSGATPLDDMPNDYRAGFPTLSIEVHVWDSNASKRFVMVNGRRYHEGDTLDSGPRLAEIAQDGLVLDYRGSRVLLSLLQ